MAYALQLPRDVTDLIYSLRDWRWEMVRDGGKTPSASCFDELPESWGCMVHGRTYIVPLFEPCYIASDGCVRAACYIPDRDLHPDKRTGRENCQDKPINVWQTDLSERGCRGASGNTTGEQSTAVWRGHAITQRFMPVRQMARDTKPEELWWQCEPCK